MSRPPQASTPSTRARNRAGGHRPRSQRPITTPNWIGTIAAAEIARSVSDSVPVPPSASSSVPVAARNRIEMYISILFLAATGTLLLVLGGSGSLSLLDVAISAAAMVPIQCGVVLGRWLRGRCPPAVFRALVLGVLACGGLDMLRRATL